MGSSKRKISRRRDPRRSRISCSCITYLEAARTRGGTYTESATIDTLTLVAPHVPVLQRQLYTNQPFSSARVEKTRSAALHCRLRFETHRTYTRNPFPEDNYTARINKKIATLQIDTEYTDNRSPVPEKA